MYIEISPERPKPRLISQIVEILRDGGIVAYPTDTFYGIGCDIFSKSSIEKIYRLKRRPRHKPFSFICSDLTNISHFAQVTNYAYKTMKRLLPGPYTFVMRGSRLVPKIMLTKRKTVGIRVPKHNICQAIVKELGHPLLSTSAATPEGEILETPHDIDSRFGHIIDVIIDAGCVPSRPSTVISLIDDEPEIIREGLGDISYFT